MVQFLRSYDKNINDLIMIILAECSRYNIKAAVIEKKNKDNYFVFDFSNNGKNIIYRSYSSCRLLYARFFSIFDIREFALNEVSRRDRRTVILLNQSFQTLLARPRGSISVAVAFVSILRLVYENKIDH